MQVVVLWAYYWMYSYSHANGTVAFSGSPAAAFSYAVAVYSPSDGTLQTMVRIHGTNSYGSALATDSSGNIIVVGQLTGNSSVFASNNAVLGSFANVASTGEGYVLKLSPTGSVIWRALVGGSLDDQLFSVAVDASDNIYVGGRPLKRGLGPSGGGVRGCTIMWTWGWVTEVQRGHMVCACLCDLSLCVILCIWFRWPGV